MRITPPLPSAGLLLFACGLLAAATVPVPARHPLCQYLAIRRSDEPSFSPDGSRIAFFSNASSSWQVWTTPSTRDTPKQLTHSSGVHHVEWAPDLDSVLIVADLPKATRARLRSKTRGSVG